MIYTPAVRKSRRGYNYHDQPGLIVVTIRERIGSGFISVKEEHQIHEGNYNLSNSADRASDVDSAALIMQ